MANNKARVNSRTQSEIFSDMHRQLRAYNSEVPASPDRMDPVLRILMQLYSHQLERIDKRVDGVWDNARTSLIRSMCPECMRWPVPAFSVMKCEPSDPVVVVDPHTKFFYKEVRDGGQVFFFSPLRNEKLINATIKNIYLRIDDSIVNLSPQSIDEMTSTSRMRTSFGGGNIYQIYIGIDYSGLPSELAGATVFLKGVTDVLKQLRWAKWYPGSNFGSFHEDCGFCPGQTSTIENLFANNDRPTDWGGLRNSAELFKSLENNFIILPEIFTSTWELGAVDSKLSELATKDGLDIDSDEHLYWVRIDLPTGGDKGKLQSSFEFSFNCFIVVNKNEMTIYKHTGGNQMVEIELPEQIESILEITSVIDSSGREYFPRHMVGESEHRVFSTEEKDNKLFLWFDFTSQLEMPPDSITVNYSVTAGTDANGIEAGKVTELYENHPGISEAVNILPASGAIPAKTEEQIVTEVAARLRNRDRALGFSGITRWIKTFDPRIISAECENGIERMDKGVRRCIIVRVTVKNDDFYSDDEVALIQVRLAEFLKSRSPVNTHYKIEMIRR